MTEPHTLLARLMRGLLAAAEEVPTVEYTTPRSIPPCRSRPWLTSHVGIIPGRQNAGRPRPSAIRWRLGPRATTGCREGRARHWLVGPSMRKGGYTLHNMLYSA